MVKKYFLILMKNNKIKPKLIERFKKPIIISISSIRTTVHIIKLTFYFK